MKKLLFIALIFITTISWGQSIKGYTLGEKLVGSDSKLTTVAGIDMYIQVEVLKDGRICRISGIPSKDGETVSRVHKSDLDRLVNGMEKNYGIKFKKRTDKYDDDSGSYFTPDFNFYVTFDYNQFRDVPYEISFSIRDKELEEILKKEEQAKADDDF